MVELHTNYMPVNEPSQESLLIVSGQYHVALPTQLMAVPPQPLPASEETGRGSQQTGLYTSAALLDTEITNKKIYTW
jgi:hypothetical protein